MGWWYEQYTQVRGNIKWDALKLAGAAMLTGAWALVQRLRHVPPDILGYLILFATSAIAFVFLGRRRLAQGAIQTPAGSLLPPNPAAVQLESAETAVKTVSDYSKLHGGPLLDELEAHFQRLAAYHRDPKERERFLVRALALGGLTYFHDVTWFTIFRSQVDALHELNTEGAMVVDGLKRFYDQGAAQNPEFYKTYSLQQWLEYMKGQAIVRQDGNIVQITVRGKDFLRYVVTTSKPMKLKKN